MYGTEELALESFKAHSAKEGKWRVDGALALLDPIFLDVIIMTCHLARAPLTRFFRWLQKPVEPYHIDGDLRSPGKVDATAHSWPSHGKGYSLAHMVNRAFNIPYIPTAPITTHHRPAPAGSPKTVKARPVCERSWKKPDRFTSGKLRLGPGPGARAGASLGLGLVAGLG